ncbi:MAG: AmmeMemoRadiSam system protein B [Phycisphaerae bacterium]
MILAEVVPPPLRPVDVHPVQSEQEGLVFVIRDPLRIMPSPLAVSPPGYFLLAHFDGERTYERIAQLFHSQFGQMLPLEELGKLHLALDQACLLYNERFAEALAEKQAAYAASDARDNRDRYPTASELAAELQAVIASGSVGAHKNLRGIVAPHLDYARGKPCYADAYATLQAAGAADRYVILGVNHYGLGRCVTATSKDFLTPLGRAKTDAAFVDALELRVGQSLRMHEFDHDCEHSIELQVHLLQAAFPDHAPTIVPILCPDPTGPSGMDPIDGQGVNLDAFCDALAAEIAADSRRTIVIAGVDLSHVGQKFGEEQPTTAEFMLEIGAFDRALLSILVGGQPERFVDLVRANQNRTRICSVGNLYVTARALPGTAFQLMRYHQAVDFAAETHVTCCAAVLA